MTESGLRAMLMRGGTSKGLYFLADDLPSDEEERDDLLLRLMGSPDPVQIDGIGGGRPLTSKVAVVRRNDTGGVDYLFLQVVVDEAVVSTRQNCGNILAGVGPFAIERGLIEPRDGTTVVPIEMLNTGARAIATVQTPRGEVEYSGGSAIDGVPGTASPVVIDFADTAGSACGALFPTGSLRDEIAGVPVTCVDNGMPVVVIAAAALGLSGDENPEELEANTGLRETLERLRLEAGLAMGLGDVSTTTVPKLSIVSAPRADGVCSTRTFIPHRVHASIGVLGAASVAAAALHPGTVADGVAVPAPGARMSIEHPSGALEVEVEMSGGTVARTGVVRTARKLFDGIAYPRA